MISRDDIRHCYDTIRPYIRRTPVIQVDLSELGELDGLAAALPSAFRIAAEPAASVGIAALLAGGYKPAPGERVTVVISGANMSPAQLG